MGSVICCCGTNREICHFEHITSGLGRKIKSISGLFECQLHEIELKANTVIAIIDGPTDSQVKILRYFYRTLRLTTYKSRCRTEGMKNKLQIRAILYNWTREGVSF